jgi:hypothetical protein
MNYAELLTPMAHFKVDTRLAIILGENYRSTELALKELVDNAWDADAENVKIFLPKAFEDGPIVISDDGCGMTTKELENEYLVIASDRIARKGEKTLKKNRKVKGRKGIGKFAGLVAADTMEIQSKARGVQTSLIVKKEDLLNSKRDIEKIELPSFTTKVEDQENGTTIILSDLNQNLAFPSIEKMKSILMFEYGRQSDFKIYVNEEIVGVEDLPGETFVNELDLKDIGKVKIKFTISNEKPLRNPGMVLKVNDKVIGKPSFFGLDDNEHIPAKLLKRIYGEVEADGLADDVTADWGAIIENSNAFQDVSQQVSTILEKEVKRTFKNEVSLQGARIQRKINSQLQKLPENRREFAKKTLERILQKFFYENDERIDTIISVILDALEHDEYWLVIQNIESSHKGDIFKLADALSEFGLIDMMNIAIQAKRRLEILDEIQILIEDDKTLEITIHKALENNLWIFGSLYSFMASNKSLKSIIENNLLRKYNGDKEKDRPDLLLSNDFSDRHLLLEFKRPNHLINRDDENQAVKYRDELSQHLSSQKIEIIVIGGKVDNKIDPKYQNNSILLTSYNSVLSKARAELKWLIRELGKN